jgi:hypothetical protein
VVGSEYLDARIEDLGSPTPQAKTRTECESHQHLRCSADRPTQENFSRATGGADYNAVMLSKERIAAYRRMTPAEKWAEVMALLDHGWEILLRLPADERERRLAIMRRERQEANDAIARALR